MNEYMESIETVEIKDILPTKTDFALNLILGSNDMGLGHLAQKVLEAASNLVFHELAFTASVIPLGTT